MSTNPFHQLLAGPAHRTGVSPIARTLEIADRTPGMISFACGNPATEALPADAIAEAAANAVRNDTVRALQYVRPRGILQEALIQRLERDGIAATDAELLPTSGAIQALALLAHALLEPGDIVITEYPTYPVNLGTFRAHGARIIGVPMDGDGMRVDLVARLLERLGDRMAGDGARVKLIYVIPDSQNPTGITMSAARRRRLIEIARQHGVPVLEDAPYRGVVYGDTPIPSIYALQREGAGTVFHVGSFAKIIAPGLRIGYLLAPPAIIDTCVMLKQGEDFCTSGLIQLITDRLIRSGAVETTVERLRDIQGAKLREMLAALERELGGVPGVEWTRPRGGLFVWLTLPPGSDSDALLERAIEERVAFIPGRYFYPGECADEQGRPLTIEPPRHALRLNFSDPPLERIAPGIATLARLIRAS